MSMFGEQETDRKYFTKKDENDKKSQCYLSRLTNKRTTIAALWPKSMVMYI